MRREQLYLAEIVESADLIEARLTGVELDRWARDEVLRDAVLYRLMIVGEAARSLSADLTARHPNVPWAGVIGLRNVVVHEYFAVDWMKVWQIAREELPGLRTSIAAIFAQEYPETWQRLGEEN